MQRQCHVSPDVLTFNKITPHEQIFSSDFNFHRILAKGTAHRIEVA
jgi:hypothetical protein